MKTIPAVLQTHMDGEATTLCYLARVETKDGTVMGFTTLDVDVAYDDGNGTVTYEADNGFEPARYQAAADMSVDNTDMRGWVTDTGITEAQIRAGFFDFAIVTIYRINYNDLTSGRHEVVGHGTAGETEFSANSWRTEFRSLTQQLKQPVSKLYSLTCRARFGSQPIGSTASPTNGEPEESFPCGKSWVWVAGSVDSVGSDPLLDFTDATFGTANAYKFGVIKWLTGDNAGHESEVATHATGGVFALQLPTPYQIQAGDTFEIREDCSKVWDDADHGCLHHWGSNRALHFRGEPHIPVSDNGSNQIPGAQIVRA